MSNIQNLLLKKCFLKCKLTTQKLTCNIVILSTVFLYEINTAESAENYSVQLCN